MSKKDKSKAALLPAIVVPLTEPPIAGDIDAADGGIGLRHTESALVVYLVNPKDGVSAGSIASLYWGNRNVPVASTPIREGEENLDLIPLTVPAHRIVEFWANPVLGKLRRASGNETFTEERKYRVMLTRPAGRDPDDALPGHQGLSYVVPPEVLLDGVNETRALAGIKILIHHWLHMHAYDLIILAWGSQQVLHRVQPGEVGRDITLTVDYATISAAGNNPLTRVAYQVKNAVGTLPDEWARWSAVSLIDVHLHQVRPEAPWLAFPDTDRVVDLAELGGWDVEIETWVTNAEAAAYDYVSLIWAGVDSEGNPFPHTPIKPLNRAGVHSFEVPNALVVAIADGTVSVHMLFQKGVVEQPSEKLYLEIVGKVVRWPPPTIDEDKGGKIEPSKEATVRFPLQGSWPPDGYLEVIFLVSSPDNTIEHRVGREVDDVEPTPEGDMLFTVYPAELQRFDGHLVEVFYAHTRPGGRPQESLRLKILVGEIQRTLPAPIIEKVIGSQLNPDDIEGYAKVFAPAGDTKRGDWVRMYWNGPLVRTNVPVQVAVDNSITEHHIDEFYVNNNLNETVAVFYTLTRGDELPRYSQVTEVLISRNLGELLAPTLLEAQITGPDTADLEPLRVQQGTQLVVRYVGMRDDDWIKPYMEGEGDGGSPDIPAKPGNRVLQEVVFDITRDAIHANIRDRDTTVVFTYAVTRGDDTKHSAKLTVKVKPIPPDELAQTVLKLNEANEATRVLDLTRFTGDATAHVGVWAFITAPYPVWLRFLGRTKDNVSHEHLLFNGAGQSKVNPTWISTGKIEYPLPRTYLNGLGNGTTLKMEFKAAVSLSKVEAKALSFPLVEYIVNTIEIPDQYPLPILTEATGTGSPVTLAPLNAQNGGTVSVAFSPMYTTDKIKVTMVGTSGLGSPVIAEKNGLAGGVVTFDIPKTAIAANIGKANKTFTLKYEVTRAGVTRSSLILTVTVTPIPVSALPQVIINRVPHNGLLDLNTITGNPLAAVLKWPFIATGQRVWITLNASGHEPLPVLTNYPILSSELNGLTNKPVSRDWLQKIPPDDPISVEIKVTLDGSADVSRAVSFAPTTYKVKRVPTVDRTDFSNYDWNEWRNVGADGALIKEGTNIYWRSISVPNRLPRLSKRYGYFNHISIKTIEISCDYRHEFFANDTVFRVITFPGRATYDSPTFPYSPTWRNMKFTVSGPSINGSFSVDVYIQNLTGNSTSIDNIVVTIL
ncbi:hypothetical protein [Pseudomonas gorinensis]|uniref:Uncharacterized protein n=3 Tax=Pseudomonas TaxID=286 RepID=A0ACA7P860_9PSED|nr:hypothetical protein [Pseudomonas sp. TKP]AHC35914.1 hypothetical protein U771_16970 [Pseudomonas sp. TKP]